MKRLILAVLLFALAPLSWAQETRQALFIKTYDLDATSYTYCVATGQNGDAFGAPRIGGSPIMTSGSSTTVTEVTTGSLPFTPLSVGDVIFTTDSAGAVAIRSITAKASGASITVDSAVNLGTSIPFTWKKVTCGTSVTSGWVSTTGWLYKKVSLQISQMDAASIDARWECRDLTYDTLPVNVYPGTVTATGTCPGGTVASNACNYTTATATSSANYTSTDMEVDVPYDACRLGLKINTDDGVDTTTHAEIISAFITMWRAK